jgi:hypothetical protein
MKKIYFLLILGLTYFVSPVKSQTNPADKWIAGTHTVDSSSINYRLFVPENYDSTVKYPLIFIFMGANYTDDDDAYFTNWDNSASNFSFADSLNQKNNPCFIVVPGLPAGENWWSPKMDPLVRGLLASTIEKYSLDENRYYITGFSLGGAQTIIALEYNIGVFAAAIPMCSHYVPEKVNAFKDVPVWNFHGQKDGTVDIKRSRELMGMYEELNSKIIYTNSKYRQEINLSDDQIKNHILAHSSPFYTEYPEGGHDVWTEAYNNPLMQDWLFSKYKLKAGAIQLSNLNDPNVYPVLSESYSINWNSENPNDSIEIWFSHNNGDSWELIQTQINNGSFDWDVSKMEDCSLGKIRILLKNNLGFVYGIDESSLFAINNAVSNGTPVVKILNQEFIKNTGILAPTINLQLLIADPEKDSVTINLLVSCDGGINYHVFDTLKQSTQIDTVVWRLDLRPLKKEILFLKAEISDNVSMTADSTLSFFNSRGRTSGGCTTSVDRDIENSEIQIYPNPFENELTIQTSRNREYSVELATITGRTVYQSEMEGNFHRINLIDLSTGIYLLLLKSDNFMSVRKVIKK